MDNILANTTHRNEKITLEKFAEWMTNNRICGDPSNMYISEEDHINHNTKLKNTLLRLKHQNLTHVLDNSDDIIYLNYDSYHTMFNHI